MKFRIVIVAGMVLGLLAAACAPATTSAPTALPETADPTWDRIQANGKMLVGTSGDYRPFEYYNELFVLDGFDVALIKAIGQKIGVPVEVNDFAFDGLASALQIGQIDAAIAAISVTEERQAAVDFSNIYFIGTGVALAKQGAGIGPLTSCGSAGAVPGGRAGCECLPDRPPGHGRVWADASVQCLHLCEGRRGDRCRQGGRD